jgi:hypothetical protein
MHINVFCYQCIYIYIYKYDKIYIYICVCIRPSTLLDLIRGNDLEIEYIFNNPLERAKVLSNLNEKSDCKWSHLETVVMQVNGIANIAKQKKLRDIEWLPTFLS